MWEWSTGCVLPMMNSIRRTLFVAYIVLCLTFCTDGQSSKLVPFTLTPTKVEVTPGSSAQFNCTIDDGHPELNSSQLVMTWHNRVNSTSSFAMRIVDSRTVSLDIVDLQRMDSTGHVFCQLNGTPFRKQQSTVVVLDGPVTPVITGCIVDNWASLTCTWEPDDQTALTGTPTIQMFSYKITNTLDRPRVCSQYVGRGPNGYGACRLTAGNGFLADVGYQIWVIANNTINRTVSKSLTVDARNIVKPGPITQLSKTNNNSRSVHLSWVPPHSEQAILYRVNCSSKWDSHTVNTANSSAVFKQLIPYTNYQVTVECIPLIHFNHTVLPIGFWSEPKALDIRTLSDVPGQAPVMTPGGYEFVHSHGDHWQLKVYWQKINERFCHGPIKRVRVRYRALGGNWNNVTVDGEYTTAALTENISRFQLYEVKVDARTDVDYNESLDISSTFIPNDTLAPEKPTEFAVFGNKSGFVHFNWTAVPTADQYTIYWCPKAVDGPRCKLQQELFWKRIPSNTTHISLELDSGEHYVGDIFIFAMSVERMIELEPNHGSVMLSSGLNWSSCTHMLNNDVRPPSDVHFAEHQLPESLIIEWKPPTCKETNYISQYIVSFCRVSSECKRPIADWSKKDVYGMAEASVTLTELSSEDEYEVRIKSWSYVGESVYTAPIRRHVSHAGLTRGAIAGIILAAIFVIVVTVLGLITVFRKCKRTLTRCLQININVPDVDGSSPKETNNGFEPRRSNEIVEEAEMESVPMLKPEYVHQNGQNIVTVDECFTVSLPEVPVAAAANTSIPDDVRISPYTKFLASEDAEPASVSFLLPENRCQVEPVAAACVLPAIDTPYVQLPTISPYSRVEKSAELPAVEPEPIVAQTFSVDDAVTVDLQVPSDPQPQKMDRLLLPPDSFDNSINTPAGGVGMFRPTDGYVPWSSNVPTGLGSPHM